MHAQLDLSGLTQEVWGLFDCPVGVALNDPRMAAGPLYPTEATHIAQARSSRRREFAAGRTAARTAMAQLGFHATAIPVAADRAPIWPDGLAGSISHSQSLCIAVVSSAEYSIGVDLEEDAPMDKDLIPEICSPEEQARIAGPDQASLAKIVFCAKEAAYKAQYPLSRELFGFDHFDVQLDLQNTGFRATFLMPAGAFGVGNCLEGRFARLGGHIVTAVTIARSTYTGA